VLQSPQAPRAGRRHEGRPARARRVRSPAGKDWTDAYQAGIALRRWWIEEVFAERFVREERAAIREFDGCLTREAAERVAGLLPEA
jgi:hypothetical protein